MGALGTVAIEIFSIVLMFFDGIIKHLFRLLYLHPYFGQEGKLERSTIFFYQLADVNPVEFERIVVVNVKPFLGKMKCLVDEISVCIIHL